MKLTYEPGHSISYKTAGAHNEDTDQSALKQTADQRLCYTPEDVFGSLTTQ